MEQEKILGGTKRIAIRFDTLVETLLGFTALASLKIIFTSIIS
jgi:hypothetical protein